jgi:hypothetical protein
MKLRINGNSIRLRLGRSEVARLAATGAIEGRAPLLPMALEYSLRLDSELSDFDVTFDRCMLKIAVPEGFGRQWALGKEVAMEGGVSGTDGIRIHVLVEKDFQCLHGEEAEDRADCYPNPLAGTPAGAAETT